MSDFVFGVRLTKKKRHFITCLAFSHADGSLAEFFRHVSVAQETQPNGMRVMKLDPKQVFARIAARISGAKTARRRPLRVILPTVADCSLESRLMLSASSDDDIAGSGGNTNTGGTGGNTNTGGTGGDTNTGGTGGDTNTGGTCGDTNTGGTGGDTNTGGTGGDTNTGGTGGDTNAGGGSGDTMPGGGDAGSTLQITMTMFMVDDTEEVGYVVGTLVPTGGDGTSVVFSMDDPSGMFAIDPNTGVITVVNQNDWADGGYGVTFHATQSGQTVDAGGMIMLASKGWKISKPGDGNLLSSKDIEVAATKPAERTDNFRVRLQLQRRESDGTWTDIADKIWSAADARQKAKFETTFTKQAAGNYRIRWQKESGGNWTDQDTKEFKIVD